MLVVHRSWYTEADVAAGSGMEWAEPDVTARTHMDRLRQLERAHPGVVHVFGLLDLFMVNGRGSNLIPGTSVNGYMDHDHLNYNGGVYAAAFLCAAFERWGFFN